jgi:hypothetical protein
MIHRLTSFILLIFIFIISACTGANSGIDITSAPIQTQGEPAKVSASTGTYFAINEIGLGVNGYVALTNFTDVVASLEGLYLCQGSKCFQLPTTVVEAGATVRIATGDGAGLDDVVATHATLGDLQPSNGEIALTTSAKPNDPKVMLLYFQWGSTPHKLTQVAVDAGLWVEGGYGPSSTNATRVFKDPNSGLWLFDEP